MKLIYRIIFFVIGLAGIGIMLWQSDLNHAPWGELLAPKSLLLLAGLLGLWLVIYLVHVTCYYVILGKEGKKIPAVSMFKICFSGFALNNVTPAGLVGGEPYRIMALKKYCSTEKASSATLTFSLFYIVGHVAMWFTGAVVYFATGSFGEPAIDILIIITTIVTLAILLIFFLSGRRGVVRPFMYFTTKIPIVKKTTQKIYDKNVESYLEIDENIRDFRTNKAGFRRVFLLQYFSRVLECVEYFLIFYYLGAHINILGGVLILTMASLIGNLIVFIPMQAGSRELGTYTALAALNISPEIGALGLIFYRVRELICIVLGILLIMFEKKKIKADTGEEIKL
ncbi:MAG: flippase-like domain-containing protein [Clostridia bacterium]|nr:flippase-like domain-containing protein [Clostridia bacterium]